MKAHCPRRWLAPEVVQTSMMDCGPACLTSLLRGFGIPASYGRLREACQTDVDGTSIDVLENVAGQMGLNASQVMLPLDQVLLDEAQALPALVVTGRAANATHFVIVWRRLGPWLQVMDPASGRRWVRGDRFLDEVYVHDLGVPAEDWRDWAGTDDFLRPLAQRIMTVRKSEKDVRRIIGAAISQPGWRPLAALDAATRLLTTLIQAGGLKAGRRAGAVLEALANQAAQADVAVDGVVPGRYWSVQPQSGDADSDLTLRGAVLLRLRGRSADVPEDTEADARSVDSLSPELRAALAEAPPQPEQTLLALLREDGLLTPFALLAAAALAAGCMLIEVLLFRGLFDVSRDLNLVQQRIGGLAGLVGFLALLLLLEVPIAVQSLRFGRHLETRLRVALLRKLPRLGDRYLQSRPISDMAERSHGVQQTRMVPDLAVRLVKSLWDLLFTLIGVAAIAPDSVPWAATIAAVAIALPVLGQPWLNERDLRVRTHAGALFNFFLDGLLGLVAVRTHGAEQALCHEHEARLTEWVRASRSALMVGLLIQTVQNGLCLSLSAWLLWDHLQRVGASGGILLLAFWTLKLPATGKQIAGLARQYPAERNALLRLLEPLDAPEEAEPDDAPGAPSATDRPLRRSAGRPLGIALRIANGSVIAAGHRVLSDLNLVVDAGEHVAIVGPSGAGKSSLLGLLLGWYRLADGDIEIDGEPLTGQRQAALRRETAWVDPAVQLWNRSLLENLCFSSGGAPTLALPKVLAAADLRGIVRNCPDGLQTRLGEGGALLSGGEGQRVRLGRALLQSDARLVLFDEPFRGLGREQRHALLQRSREAWRHSTLFCVTHDVAETLGFDRVLVIDQGRIIEDGAPAALAGQASRYRDLLHTEETVRRTLWSGDFWRRVRVEAGTVCETDQRARQYDTHRRTRAGLAGS